MTIWASQGAHAGLLTTRLRLGARDEHRTPLRGLCLRRRRDRRDDQALAERRLAKPEGEGRLPLVAAEVHLRAMREPAGLGRPDADLCALDRQAPAVPDGDHHAHEVPAQHVLLVEAHLHDPDAQRSFGGGRAGAQVLAFDAGDDRFRRALPVGGRERDHPRRARKLHREGAGGVERADRAHGYRTHDAGAETSDRGGCDGHFDDSFRGPLARKSTSVPEVSGPSREKPALADRISLEGVTRAPSPWRVGGPERYPTVSSETTRWYPPGPMITDVNPFVYSRPISPEEIVDRDEETRQLLKNAVGGHYVRLYAPRKYGKTSLLRRALADGEKQEGLVPVLVDLYGAVSLADVAVRFERAYAKELRGGIRRSHIQFQGDVASYVFAGSEPGLMKQLFETKDAPLYGAAVPVRLGRLRDQDLAGYVAERFAESKRNVGEALNPLLASAKGHPQRAMLLAHRLWEEVEPKGA